jgi:hypothetical protein
VYQEGNRVDLKDYVSLIGAGQKNTIIQIAGDHTAFLPDSHASIENLTIKGVRTGGGGAWIGISTGYGNIDLVIKDVTLDNTATSDFSSYGLYVGGTTSEITAENVTIIGSQYGVRIMSGASDHTVELRNCHIETRNTPTAVGLSVESSLTNEVRVYDSTIKGVYYSLMGPGTVHAYGCCLGGTNLTSTADLHLCYNTNYAPMPDQ